MNLIQTFVERVIATNQTGAATEHSYRSAIESLFNGLAHEVCALNEPKRVECGAPDFIIQRGDLAIGHVEAKDLGIPLRSMKEANQNQQERYRKALPNLIYTNCLEWDFYRNGELVASTAIGEFDASVQADPSRYPILERLLRDFVAQQPQAITNPRRLAEIMAGKAVLIKEVLRQAIKADEHGQTELTGQFGAFREHLIHDITADEFADIYAETIAYGMFAARLHAPVQERFTRQTALVHLPKSNPFLRSLFGYIAGVNLDERIAWIIDDLAIVFEVSNIKLIMKEFGKFTGQHDPFLHFYETFLAAYNPAKRKSRGVWYTPEPVVNFIVRAVDEVLQKEFGLADGLADTSKVTVEWDTGQTDKKGKPVLIRKPVHRVQILDPATGTGTFLAETIKQIAPKVKEVASGMWSNYIEQNLIPRLHGFELLMASYAMCHMKLDIILSELGYKPTGGPPRLSVYLTNSLEEGEPANQSLPFAQWLSNEVKQANTIKRDMPIMCVIGNPPYSISSSNKSTWITDLIAPYKSGLEETSLNALSDDYVKFIRLAESYIENRDTGVVAMITNNSFVDGVVHRKMRHHLRLTFDTIYVVNLHGDANKKEKSPSGEVDSNIFDIRQGVAIIVAIKKIKSSALADVYVKDVWGDRKTKYEWLLKGTLLKTEFEAANFHGDYHFFTNKPFGDAISYEAGFKISDFFLQGLSGIKFRKDKLLITNNFTSDDAIQMVRDVVSLEASTLLTKYGFSETADWQVQEQRVNFRDASDLDIVRIAYRPFDFRYTYYPRGRINKIIPRGDSRRGLMGNMLAGENIALLSGRQNKSGTTDHFLLVDCPSEMKTGESTIQSYHFPLYIYPDEQDFDQTRCINFDHELYARLQSIATHHLRGVPDELAAIDYIYGVLHCPAYRKRYAEFLRIDFPRIPWPTSSNEFWDISDQGATLRKLHLMSTGAIGKTPYPFAGEGDSVVSKPFYDNNKIWINASQYFDCVPDISWSFRVGGYEPAQKWLKDRRGRTLTFDSVVQYQRILKVLSETDRVMRGIKMTFA